MAGIGKTPSNAVNSWGIHAVGANRTAKLAPLGPKTASAEDCTVQKKEIDQTNPIISFIFNNPGGRTLSGLLCGLARWRSRLGTSALKLGFKPQTLKRESTTYRTNPRAYARGYGHVAPDGALNA